MDILEVKKLIENLIALNILEWEGNPEKDTETNNLYYVLVIKAPNMELIEIMDELMEDLIHSKVGYLN